MYIKCGLPTVDITVEFSPAMGQKKIQPLEYWKSVNLELALVLLSMMEAIPRAHPTLQYLCAQSHGAMDGRLFYLKAKTVRRVIVALPDSEARHTSTCRPH